MTCDQYWELFDLTMKMLGLISFGALLGWIASKVFL